MKKLLIHLTILMLLPACGRNDLPQRPGNDTGINGGATTPQPSPDIPDNPLRPGIPPVNLDDELADATPRVDTGTFSLKYTDGGVLFSQEPNGQYSVIDLDGTSRVSFNPGTMLSDSTLTGSHLSINGNLIATSRFTIAKSTISTHWYIGTTADSTSIIIVLPRFR